MSEHLVWLQRYDLLMGLLSVGGVSYLLYLQRATGVYNRFVYYVAAAIVVFGVGGPVANLLVPHWIHLVHAIAALLIVFALYSPMHNDLRDQEWANLILSETRVVRDRENWMTRMDDDILELFFRTDLVLTPSTIAHNLEYSRGEVNRHLSELVEHGFVERVARGKYQLTSAGAEYLRGETDG